MFRYFSFSSVIALRVSVIASVPKATHWLILLRQVARHEAIQVKALSYGLLRRLAMTLHVFVIPSVVNPVSFSLFLRIASLRSQ